MPNHFVSGPTLTILGTRLLRVRSIGGQKVFAGETLVTDTHWHVEGTFNPLGMNFNCYWASSLLQLCVGRELVYDGSLWYGGWRQVGCESTLMCMNVFCVLRLVTQGTTCEYTCYDEECGSVLCSIYHICSLTQQFVCSEFLALWPYPRLTPSCTPSLPLSHTCHEQVNLYYCVSIHHLFV